MNGWHTQIPGIRMLHTFRSVPVRLLFCLCSSPRHLEKMIRMLHQKQIGEEVRLRAGRTGAEKGTPTMGGLIILFAIIIPTLLFARLDNIYILDAHHHRFSGAYRFLPMTTSRFSKKIKRDLPVNSKFSGRWYWVCLWQPPCF